MKLSSWLKRLCLAATMLAVPHAVPLHAEPMILPVQGILAAPGGGTVDATELELTIRLYRSQTGGSAFHVETHELPVSHGLFLAPLGTLAPLDTSAFDGTEIWVGVSVLDEDEMTPRFPLATIPHAAHAARAASVRWDDLSDVPELVAAAGGYVSGTGVTINAARQLSLNGAACFPGQMWLWNGSAWACGSPSAAISGTDGILALNGYVAVDTAVVQRLLGSHNCEFGIRSIGADGSVTCAANEDTDTNVYGRACTAPDHVLRGFDASGNPLCVADANTNAINRGCGSNGVLRGFEANGTPICLPMATVDTNARNRGCEGNQVLRGFDGTGSPVCVNDNNADKHVWGQTCPSGQVVRGFSSLGSPICVTERNSLGTYTANNGLRISTRTDSTTGLTYQELHLVSLNMNRTNESGRLNQTSCGGNMIAYGWQDASCNFLSCKDYIWCANAAVAP